MTRSIAVSSDNGCIPYWGVLIFTGVNLCRNTNSMFPEFGDVSSPVVFKWGYGLKTFSSVEKVFSTEVINGSLDFQDWALDITEEEEQLLKEFYPQWAESLLASDPSLWGQDLEEMVKTKTLLQFVARIPADTTKEELIDWGKEWLNNPKDPVWDVLAYCDWKTMVPTHLVPLFQKLEKAGIKKGIWD